MTARDSAEPGALPPEFSSFVGRRTVLATARAQLGSARLLTLLGPGGVGKTRIGVRLAQSVRRLYPEGVWFIDLSAVGAGGSVVDEVSRILELPDGYTDRSDAVPRFFGTKRGLIVLDNCDSAIEECARLVRTVLDECPHISIVATSRTLLRLTAEVALVVEPLETALTRRGAVPPATALFLERCAATLPHPTSADLDAIAEICRRLDGLPLAIELAATRVRALTPSQILDRLAEPLALLTRGNRDAPSRQQTLRATISWSYELCTEAERTLWRQMSVFVGGWDLHSAESMSTAGSDHAATLDVVQSLLEKSILTRRTSADVVSYDMLETVRMFGLEVASEEELDRTRIRHRDACLNRLAELEADWYGPNQARWLALSRRELPNIRAALDFCLSNRDAARAATLLVTAWRVVWQAHGRTDELRRWSSRVLHLESTPTPEICQLTALLGLVEILEGDQAAGDRHLSHAARLTEELDDDFSRAFADFCSGSAIAHPSAAKRDLKAAIVIGTRSLALQGGSNAIPARADVAEKLALAHDLLGQRDVAERMREALVAGAIRVGESFETAMLLTNSGVIAARRRELDSATTFLREALRLTRNLDNPAGAAQTEEALAFVAAEGHDYIRAATLLGVSHPIGDPAGAIASAFPGNSSFRVDLEDVVRRMLGQRTYAAAVSRGRALSRDDGVAYALGADLPARSSEPGTAPQETLSPRESQVVALVGQGLSDREIAARLVISTRTAEGHVAKSLSKLGFTSRAQLAVWITSGARKPEP